MRDAARTEDTTPLEAGLDTSGIPATDGLNLSRRERRRIERLEHPVETWTAEEEMLATGQIPAMTPARIAEQEKIEREAAEAAQRDAETAAQARLERQHGGVVNAVAVESAEEVDAPQEAPRRTSLLPAAEAQVEPEPEPEPEAVVEPEPDPEPEPEAVVEPEPEPEAVVEPEPEPEPEPEAVVEPEPEPEAEAVAATEPEPEVESASPLGMPPGMSPEMFAALFPPGSLQRKAMEQQARDAAEDASPSPEREPEPEPEPLVEAEPEPEPVFDAEPESLVSLDPQVEKEAEHAAEELQAADADVLSVDDTTLVIDDAEAEAQRDDQAFPWIATSAAAGAALGAAVHTPAEPVAQPVISEPSPVTSWTAQEPLERTPDAAEGIVAEQPSFDAILGTGAIPVAPSDTTEVEGTAPVDAAAFAPVDVAPAPSMWEAHPLSTAALPQVQVQEQVDIDEDELESEPLPRPDLSGVRPLSAVHTGEFPPVEPVPTGQIEVERRERPELGPAGGARHFGWAQVAVLGAVAFVLGVVVWNVAGMG
ncbi:hypothetical protein [Demequina litorisediminis]|uniref:Uncharacterized protein n=1 Tax=Demequina litorisediminis TaxID=1849022 RepID=A0ABQ6I9G8_9MICO|nr:hypothetical protein [Demequina litorisediminis]GMA34361.1 hypothetical protein GCM10025876_05650 [Demequina litorisediminis]